MIDEKLYLLLRSSLHGYIQLPTLCWLLVIAMQQNHPHEHRTTVAVGFGQAGEHQQVLKVILYCPPKMGMLSPAIATSEALEIVLDFLLHLFDRRFHQAIHNILLQKLLILETEEQETALKRSF